MCVQQNKIQRTWVSQFPPHFSYLDSKIEHTLHKQGLGFLPLRIGLIYGKCCVNDIFWTIDLGPHLFHPGRAREGALVLRAPPSWLVIMAKMQPQSAPEITTFRVPLPFSFHQKKRQLFTVLPRPRQFISIKGAYPLLDFCLLRLRQQTKKILMHNYFSLIRETLLINDNTHPVVSCWPVPNCRLTAILNGSIVDATTWHISTKLAYYSSCQG